VLWPVEREAEREPSMEMVPTSSLGVRALLHAVEGLICRVHLGGHLMDVD